MTFQRENRYIVIKRKDLDAAAAEGAVDASFAEVLDVVCDNLPTRECLVIESDWPEYEPAWRMIQARVEGATLSPAHIEDGEEVEVVAWADPSDLNLMRRHGHTSCVVKAAQDPCCNEPLMTVAQHQRIVAARSAPHEQAELWAVHVEGPDDLYAAFSREDAERHASELNAIQIPELGVSISAVVIPSPWGAVEHWQYMAEQEREHVESMRAALSAPPAAGVPGDSYLESCAAAAKMFEQLAPTPPASEQQRAVVMPEKPQDLNHHERYRAGWNACVAEFLRLNPHLAKGEGV